MVELTGVTSDLPIESLLISDKRTGIYVIIVLLILM